MLPWVRGYGSDHDRVHDHDFDVAFRGCAQEIPHSYLAESNEEERLHHLRRLSPTYIK